MTMNWVVVTRDAPVWQLRLDRPEKKNALTAAMYTALADALDAASSEPACRALLLAGAGDCFTAGNDLAEFANPGERGAFTPVARFLSAISRFDKPLLAAPCGLAIGIGTTMLLHCDFAIAGSNARFQLPFVNLGLCPEAGSSYLLPRLAGYQRAAQLLLLGEPFDAAQAQAIGLVSDVVDAADAVPRALALAHKLAAKPPAALRASKALLRRSTAATIADTIAAESAQFTTLLGSAEAKEAFTAFFERRPADFSRFN